MCGRYSGHLKAMHGWKDILKDWPSNAVRYNTAPTTNVPTYTSEGLQWMRWGLVPSWSKEPTTKYSTFNAKLETVAEKPAFRSAWKHERRCLIPSGGYYEWRTEEGVKQPYFVHAADGSPVVFGGLYEHWEGTGDAPPMTSCTILTRSPIDDLKPLHHRMPVMLKPEDAGRWLKGMDVHEAEELARLEVPEGLTYHRVDRAVGNVRNEGSQLVREA